MTMKCHTKETERFKRTISSLDLQVVKNVPLFGDDKWDAPEEIVLLTLIQILSYGNWSLLAEILTEKSHKKFTAEEVKEHYVNTYLEGDIAKAMKSAESNTTKSSLIDHCSMEDDECLKSADMNAWENVPQNFLENMQYMPLREDFKREYDSTAEELIQNLDFSLATDDYDKNVNLILLDIYRNRLMKRIERKKAVKKYRLVEKFFGKNNPSYENKYPEENLPSPESYSIHEINELSSTSKKTRHQRFNHHSVKQNLENHTYFSVQSDSSSENEADESDKNLCTDLGLKPAYYNQYKLFLTYVDLERSEGRYPNENLIPAHMTVAQCVRIVNFMEKAGLVKNKNLLNVLDIDD